MLLEWLNRLGILIGMVSFIFLTPQLIGREFLIRLDTFIENFALKTHIITESLLIAANINYVNKNKIKADKLDCFSVLIEIGLSLFFVFNIQLNERTYNLMGILMSFLLFLFSIMYLFCIHIFLRLSIKKASENSDYSTLLLLLPLFFGSTIYLGLFSFPITSFYTGFLFFFYSIIGWFVGGIILNILIRSLGKSLLSLLRDLIDKMKDDNEVTERWAAVGIFLFFIGSILQFIGTF